MPESTGKAFFVSTTGNDASRGTRAKPWRTIQKAVNTIKAGQRALVAPGIYAEGVSITRDLRGPRPGTIEALHPRNRPIIGWIRIQNRGSTSAAAYWRLRNLIVDGNVRHDQPDGAGIKITGGATPTVPNHIELYGVEVRNIHGFFQSQGLSIQGGLGTRVPYRLDFYNMLIHNITGTDSIRSHSFYAGQAESVVFANCVSRDSQGWGFRIGSSSSSTQGVRDSFFVNDTVVRSSLAGGFTLYAAGPGTPPNYLDGGNVFYNNIVSDTPAQPAYNSSFLPQVDGPSNSTNLWGRNLAYHSGGLFFNGDGRNVSSAFVSPPVNVDPLFVNEAGDDFHLRADSPAIGAGIPEYTPRFDFDGKPRTTADLGAY
jgi:hypothetical protein